MNEPTMTEPTRKKSIPVTELFPGELFRFENDPRLIRLVRIDEPSKAGYIRITIGNLGNSEGDRGMMLSASTQVVPGWL